MTLRPCHWTSWVRFYLYTATPFQGHKIVTLWSNVLRLYGSRATCPISLGIGSWVVASPFCYNALVGLLQPQSSQRILCHPPTSVLAECRMFQEGVDLYMWGTIVPVLRALLGYLWYLTFLVAPQVSSDKGYLLRGLFFGEICNCDGLPGYFHQCVHYTASYPGFLPPFLSLPISAGVDQLGFEPAPFPQFSVLEVGDILDCIPFHSVFFLPSLFPL